MSNVPNANNPEEMALHYATIQKNWLDMKGFVRDPMLIQDIPEIATNLIWNEFQFKITYPKQLPFVFVEAWDKILEFISNQKVPEFSGQQHLRGEC